MQWYKMVRIEDTPEPVYTQCLVLYMPNTTVFRICPHRQLYGFGRLVMFQLDVADCYRRSTDGLCVCRLITTVSPAERLNGRRLGCKLAARKEPCK